VVAAAGALWAARIYGRAEAVGRSAHAAKGGWDLEEADGTARQPRGLRFSPAGRRKGQQDAPAAGFEILTRWQAQRAARGREGFPPLLCSVLWSLSNFGKAKD